LAQTFSNSSSFGNSIHLCTVNAEHSTRFANPDQSKQRVGLFLHLSPEREQTVSTSLRLSKVAAQNFETGRDPILGLKGRSYVSLARTGQEQYSVETRKRWKNGALEE
jgi:hypothetical protein